MILTAAAIIMILVTVAFSNNLLNTRMAENEFSTNKQFMRTIGLQIDDVAWTIGRTQTVSYTCRFGYINFQEAVLNYNIEVHTTSETHTLELQTGIIMYNVPVSTYSVGENYFEPIMYTGYFVQNGSLAPVSQVYCIEKLSMANGSSVRVVVAPTIRMLNSTLVGYENLRYKFYLPILETGQNRYGSNSISLTGSSIYKQTYSDVTSVTVRVGFPNFPKEEWGFDGSFFKFVDSEITIDTNNAEVEFYAGTVAVGVAYGG